MPELDQAGPPWREATADGVPASRAEGFNGFGSPDGERAAFERVPPQDLAAEQSVLGGMLLSKDAIADVIEVLKGQDFYKPAHETIYAAILDLYARGEPADPITTAAELTKRGELAKVGGPGYVQSLVNAVPTAANAEYYAHIVRDRAVLRRLVQAGTRITQMGYAADGDVDDIVDSAQAEIFAVTEQRTTEDYLPLGEIMEGTLDEIEAISNRSGEMTGVPTGFTDLDSLTNGLHPGQMIVIAARPAMGKALALGTPLPTPDGWTTMGEVQPGDLLLDASGTPTRVVAASDVMTERPCFEVAFDDGTTVVADADHEWLTSTRDPRGSARATAVRTTKEIAGTLHCLTAGRRGNHTVANAAPLDLPHRDVPVPPYVLGAWLGGGHGDAARIATADAGIVRRIAGQGYEVRRLGGTSTTYAIGSRGGVREAAAPTRADRGACSGHDGSLLARLRDLGVLGHKHIPQSYLRGSLTQRRELLAGLLDTEGSVTGTGSVRFATTHRALAETCRELVIGLGYHCGMAKRRGAGRSGRPSTAYLVTFTPGGEVFGLARKRRIHAERGRPGIPELPHRTITAVRETDSVPVRCVQVDNPDRLYLATRSMIPTHNSTLALDFARACSIRHSLPSVIFSLEMGRNEIAMRLLSAEARVALHHMRSGSMTDEDWNRLARQMAEVNEAPLYIDDSPNLTMMEIRAKCRRLRQRNDLQLVIVDYLQLMQTGAGRRPESRQQEVSEMSRNLKLLAKELEVPVVALSQLNRGPEQRTDKKPIISDLRESGCVTAGTRVLRADTGTETTVGELLRSGERDIPVWSVDGHLRLVRRTMTHVFPSGTKEVFRLRLASGREIEATANHPFLTPDGWTALGDLSVGARVGVPRRLDAPTETASLPEPEVVMLAHLLGGGCLTPGQPLHYPSGDEACLRAVAEAAAHFGVTPRRVPHRTGWRLDLAAPRQPARGHGNPIAAWLDRFGLHGRRAHERFLPPTVFALPDAQLRLFLRHLWATAGSVTVAGSGAVRVCYATTSERLARDLQCLLLRVDVRARLRRAERSRGRAGWTVDVPGADDQRRFLREVGAHGARTRHVIPARDARLRDIAADASLDTVPEEVWREVRRLMRDGRVTAGPSPSSSGAAHGGPSGYHRPAPGRGGLARVAELLRDEKLELLATSDILWDPVVAIEALGECEVYDATVPGTHNFVANGISIHNSIEQDADMVILLHREDAYEKESPRAGEADLIVAKHRNGPTATVTVAFQGHYSRFVNMQGGF